MSDDLYLADSAETDARVATLPPPSEDARHLLPPIDITDDEASDEYLPESAVSWIVDVRLASACAVHDIAPRFDADWRKIHGGLTIYGKDADTDKWTYLVSKDGPTAVTALKFAWDYYNDWDDDFEIADEDAYRARLAAIAVALAGLTAVVVSNAVTPAAAVDRAKTLRDLLETFDEDEVEFTLTAEDEFDGQTVWDVMTSVGLRWADMDCFHWENPYERGDSYFFSVATNSDPGYFLPEDIAAGEAVYEDLVFSFSIVRCAAPAAVFDVMKKVIAYAQSRLGGEIDYGEVTRADVESTLEKLKGAGLAPGASATLQLF